MDFLVNHLFGIVDSFLILITAITGYIVIKNVKREAIIKIQEQTIGAYTQQNEVLQSQIDSLRDGVDDLKKENLSLRQIIETIKDALKAKGMIITIDGDLVTITDLKGSASSIRRRSIKPDGEGK
ncbi:hypothetical protein ccbrp13_56320 [Ktedonobacteria bacterium brp13]|nr:hypothetical protein ccbrp13_56320 [Ktedonobacteria bacterium brp13]